MTLLFNNKLSIARRTNVVVIRVRAVDRAQGIPVSLSDPAMGTLEITVERWREIERAVTRYARCLELRFKLRDVELRIAYLLAKGQLAALEFICYLNGNFFQFGIGIGHDWLLSKGKQRESGQGNLETHNELTGAARALSRSIRTEGVYVY